MAVVKNLLVRAGADFSELQKEMLKAQKFMKKAGDDIADIGKTMTLGLTVPLLGIGAVGIKTASDLKEVQNVIDTAFGESAKSVDAWAKSAITGYGLSELQAKQFAGTMRSMLGSMGLSSTEADSMSMSLSGLAGDMASFYNLDPTEAFDKLRSGISGETEPLKALGINMSVANMEAYALSKGISTSWKEMSAAEQATLRYGYIMDTTKNSQGDFAKTNTGFANSMRVVKEQLKTVAAQFGTLILPYLETFLGKMRSVLDYLQKLSPEMQKKILVVAGIVAAIGPLLLIIGKLLTVGAGLMSWGRGIVGAFKAVALGTKGVGAIMTAVFGPAGIVLLVIAGIALLVGGLIWLWNNNENFKNFIINTWNYLVTTIMPILTAIKDFLIITWTNIWTTIEPILITLKDTIINAFTYVWATLQPVIEAIKQMLGAAWEFISALAQFIFNGLKIYFTVYFEIIKTIIGAFVTAISWVWTNFGDIITKVFKNAWDTVVGIFTGVVNVIKGIFQILTGLLTGNWEKCWEGMKNVVGGIWSGIVAVIKGGINMLIGSLNFFTRGLSKIKIPKWVPGVGGMGFNIPEIPMLAKGTDYFKGGPAIVGEQGPELVNMPRGSQVTPNNKTMDILNNKGNMLLKLFIDGREFAQALAPFNGEESASFNLRTGFGGAY